MNRATAQVLDHFVAGALFSEVREASAGFLDSLDEHRLPSAVDVTHDLVVGDAVRLLRVPEFVGTLPRKMQRVYGKLEGELFEVVALTLPDQVAIARWVRLSNGEHGYQVFFVDAVDVERLEPAASPAPSGH